jgi:hypothetical protein
MAKPDRQDNTATAKWVGKRHVHNNAQQCSARFTDLRLPVLFGFEAVSAAGALAAKLMQATAWLAFCMHRPQAIGWCILHC